MLAGIHFWQADRPLLKPTLVRSSSFRRARTPLDISWDVLYNVSTHGGEQLGIT